MFGWLKERKRRRLRAKAAPPHWLALFRQRVPHYDRMPETVRTEFHGHVHVLMAEKYFEGCAGFAVDDECRLTICGMAALLLMGGASDYYPGVLSILVYPSAFYVTDTEHGDDGIVSVIEEERAGEAWDYGVVVLAWEEVVESYEEPGDGYNVVLHEFAHQLDFQDGLADGAPVLDGDAQAESWGATMQRHYDELTRRVARRRYSIIDEYGATNPAEFFAVTTEFFFERPQTLQRHYPDLYDVLSRFFGVDPALWAA